MTPSPMEARVVRRRSSERKASSARMRRMLLERFVQEGAGVEADGEADDDGDEKQGEGHAADLRLPAGDVGGTTVFGGLGEAD
jgi:hypothetical protein